jgi:hypothetical protein
VIKGDSTEYDLLEKWSSINCDGFKTVEIGVREGLGSKIIMDNAENYMMHIGIDPYGNLKYQHYDNHEPLTYDYTDDMRDRMIKDFESYRGKFKFCNMTDKKFMIENADFSIQYALVHFDGPHMTRDVLTEAVFFAERCAPFARFIFDDYPKYNMQLISDCLKPYGFSVMEQGQNKICLEKQNT